MVLLLPSFQAKLLNWIFSVHLIGSYWLRIRSWWLLLLAPANEKEYGMFLKVNENSLTLKDAPPRAKTSHEFRLLRSNGNPRFLTKKIKHHFQGRAWSSFSLALGNEPVMLLEMGLDGKRTLSDKCKGKFNEKLRLDRIKNTFSPVNS